ncbi:hypothetical protein L218DRAFT_1028235 [Marasmius fiardii PR-910]|nr:hypothetical protein L218DRAFT_1028235 [Marasmius fiardii PR-910]
MLRQAVRLPSFLVSSRASSLALIHHGPVVTVAPKKFLTLPLGDILPSGWLFDQLVLQNDGLAGHEHEFYEYISETDWTGGNLTYSNLEEAGSYWFNGMVPSGILVNNEIINSKTESFLDYVLSHQDSTGWLGPEVGTTKPRYLWGRYPFFFGAIQLTEVNLSLTDRVVDGIHKFVKLANMMLQNNEGLDDGGWAKTRWEDFVIVLQWLYEFHPNGEEELLLDTMKRLKWTGVPWEQIFSPEVRQPFTSWHGVNMAEGLKALPATYRFTHNQSDLAAASQAWDLLFQYHGRPSGIFAGDEYLAGLEAVRGSELCMVVETMFSGSYLYQVMGELKFADRVERIAYNALPATITGDMWSRQYFQQQNQIAAQKMNPNPFPKGGAYANVFGLQPFFPCCTVNFPQGWPKFVTNSFVTTPDRRNLVQVYLGPFSVSTELASGNKVTVSVDTAYPFSDELNVTINASRPYTHYIRVPGWVVNGSYVINGGDPQLVSPGSDGIEGLQAIEVPSGSTSIALRLPAEIEQESRPHGSVAIHRGPLHYAYDIPRVTKVLRTDDVQPLAKDLQFNAAEPWQYAIDPTTLKFMSTPDPVELPSPIFDSEKPPLWMTVDACLIDWSVAGDTFVSSPPELPACVGEKIKIRLWPFGATKLRIGEFPVMKA